jgi:histidinol phosphatase-like PHP family hydrolase
MLFDFHTHTLFTDGVLLPIELIRRAAVNGYTAIGITDHASASNLEHVIPALVRECELAAAHWEIQTVPGVELTHLPPAAIPELAEAARRLGAKLVVVHGETPVEPVAEGTNLAAVQCKDVDILAHPGLLDDDIAAVAARTGVFLEISAHGGHCFGNGRVALAAQRAGARLLLNSDAHRPNEVLTAEFARRVALGAGLPAGELETVLVANPQLLLSRLASRT